MKALILAAGIGRRLKISIPKIMLKIGNKTLLDYYRGLEQSWFLDETKKGKDGRCNHISVRRWF